MQIDKFFFVKEQLKWLGKILLIEQERYVDYLWRRHETEQLCIFLKSIAGEYLDYERQKDISRKIALFAQIPGKWETFKKKRINNFLKTERIPFMICSVVVERMTYWMVKEVKYDEQSMDG